MAFYTVAHLLQRGDMYGDDRSGPIQPEDLTPEVPLSPRSLSPLKMARSVLDHHGCCSPWLHVTGSKSGTLIDFRFRVCHGDCDKSWRWQVWDHIFLDGPPPADSRVPADVLSVLRREFDYWCALPAVPNSLGPYLYSGLHL